MAYIEHSPLEQGPGEAASKRICVDRDQNWKVVVPQKNMGKMFV